MVGREVGRFCKRSSPGKLALSGGKRIGSAQQLPSLQHAGSAMCLIS